MQTVNEALVVLNHHLLPVEPHAITREGWTERHGGRGTQVISTESRTEGVVDGDDELLVSLAPCRSEGEGEGDRRRLQETHST